MNVAVALCESEAACAITEATPTTNAMVIKAMSFQTTLNDKTLHAFIIESNSLSPGNAHPYLKMSEEEKQVFELVTMSDRSMSVERILEGCSSCIYTLWWSGDGV